MIEHRYLALFCHGFALVAIVFMGITGERWPLGFVGTMIAGGIIIGVGDLLGGRRDG